MSIYASLRAPGEDHKDTCAIYVETEPHVFELSGKQCDCGLEAAPIIYQGSHVLPSDDDQRGGDIDIALIPNHITRDGRDDRPEGGSPWPYLRFGIHSRPSDRQYEGKPYVEGGDATVVLTRSQVEQIRDTLDWWLSELDPRG